MAKILFAFPPPEDDITLPKGGYTNGWYGCGIPSIMSYVEQSGHETDGVIDLNYTWDEFFPELLGKTESFKPDYIAMQLYSTNRLAGFKTYEEIVRLYPDKKVIFGGHHTSVFATQIADRFKGCICVIGEGEVTVKEILDGKSLEEINGIAFWDGTTVVVTPEREPPELDDLPFPKHEAYLDKHPDWHIANIMTTRGCFRNCIFCCLKHVSRRKYRVRSIENLMKEIDYIHERFPQVDTISIQDDMFTVNNKRVIEFCKEYLKRGYNYKFIMAGSVKPATKEMLYWMNEAGLTHIYVGLENGNQGLLDRAHKEIKLEDVVTFFEKMKPYPKLVVSTYLITGLPGETWDTVKETVDLVQSLQRISYDYVDDSTIIWAYPGTEICQMMEEAGKLDDEYWFQNNPCPNYTLEHSFDELKKMRYYLLDRVSFTRFFTPKGFYHQFKNAPINILKFMWYHPIFIRYSIGMSMSLMFPRFTAFVRGYKLQERWKV
jgi:radical SAM superfamily enzyme YgiQ (UPF0313 family)